MARTNRAEWAKRVERWKDSGLTAKEFSSEIGVKASTLTFWKWKLRSEAGESMRRRRGAAKPKATVPSSLPRFVEVTVPAVASVSSVLELVLEAGVRVRIPADFEEATLTRVLRAVEAAR
jgi:hypothetical protein